MTLLKKKNLKSSDIFKKRNNNWKLTRRRSKELLCPYMTRTATCQTLIMKLFLVQNIIYLLRAQCHGDFDLFWSKPCCNTFTYKITLKHLREQNQPIFERGQIMVCSSPFLEKNVIT